MNKEHEEKKKQMDTEFITLRNNKELIISQRKQDLDDIRDWLEVKEEKIHEMNTLEKVLDEGREKHRQDLATIKKERAAAIDKLRKEMLMNIRNVKIQMLTMNED